MQNKKEHSISLAENTIQKFLDRSSHRLHSKVPFDQQQERLEANRTSTVAGLLVRDHAYAQ
jgi:hypothetical protein